MKYTKLNKSLRLRISWLLALQTIVGLGVICAMVYIATAATISQRQDEILSEKTAMIRHFLSYERVNSETEASKNLLYDLLVGHGQIQLQLFTAEGQRLLTVGPPSNQYKNVKQQKFNAPATGIFNGKMKSGVLTVSTDDDDKILRRLSLTLITAALLGTLVISAGGFLLVSRGLKPLEDLVEQTSGLTSNNLERRLNGSEQPLELQPLIAQFNALLERLTISYRQLERFNADVAHELNTPLAVMISSCELTLRKSRSSDELLELSASTLEELRRLADIVKDMLFVSQAERGANARRAKVDSLAVLVEAVIEFYDAAIEERHHQIHIRGDSYGHFDIGLLQRAISNLLDNALQYATPKSIITVAIDRLSSKEVSILVCNQGVTIDANDLPRIFDRFYRNDLSRTQNGSHYGLGLSIVEAIARMHGGRVIAESKNGLTRIGVCLFD